MFGRKIKRFCGRKIKRICTDFENDDDIIT